MSAFYEDFDRETIVEQNAGQLLYGQHKIVISRDSKVLLIKQLRQFDITAETLSPSLDEWSTAIKKRYSNDLV